MSTIYFGDEPKEFIEKHLKKKYKDTASYNYRAYQPIEEYFGTLDLKTFPLEKIEKLTWASYSEIVFNIWGNYDGEDDYFALQSLEGIEICPNIKRIHIEYVWSVTDLAPLSKLNQLEEITVFSGKIKVNSLKPLQELPNLKKIYLQGLVFADQEETDKLVELLISRGIKVKME